jgi:hypothetical protein
MVVLCGYRFIVQPPLKIFLDPSATLLLIIEAGLMLTMTLHPLAIHRHTLAHRSFGVRRRGTH